MVLTFQGANVASIRCIHICLIYCTQPHNVALPFLHFTVQPEITAHPQNETGIEGQNVTFTCNATGNPAPTISWTTNGSTHDTSHNSRISFSVDNKQLTITNVNRTDSGEYRCVANNSVGNATSDAAILYIQCK